MKTDYKTIIAVFVILAAFGWFTFPEIFQNIPHASVIVIIMSIVGIPFFINEIYKLHKRHKEIDRKIELKGLELTVEKDGKTYNIGDQALNKALHKDIETENPDWNTALMDLKTWCIDLKFDTTVTYEITIEKIEEIDKMPDNQLPDFIEWLQWKAIELGKGKHHEYYTHDETGNDLWGVTFAVNTKNKQP